MTTPDFSVELLHNGSKSIDAANPVHTQDGTARATLEAIRVLLDRTQTVTGSVTVSNPTPAPETGLAKDGTLTSGAVRVGGTVAVSGPLTDAQLRASRVPVELPPGGAGLTNTELRAAAVPVQLAPGTAFAGYVGSYEDDAAKQGRYRFAGGKATTNVTSPNASMTLTNPAGSGVDIVITRYQVEVDAAADVVLIYDAVSTGTLVANTNPSQRSTVTNPGEVRVGSGVLTGGDVQSPIRRAQPNSPVAVGPFRFRITPGRTFTVRFLGPGATNTVWFNIGWFVVGEGADLA